jgi:wyosine [tRNA(Phe)-imidazoG37] synthetase (radical SAM superfamily)
MRKPSNLAFGPVVSRRFGSSLGLSTVPLKICNYSCVYCQLGPTHCRTIERACYYSPTQVVEALDSCLGRSKTPPDFVTVIGEGEPTLARNLGAIMKGVRKAWKGNLALVTNGSLLGLDEVKDVLNYFDVVSPTVSAADPSTFRRLHRPHPSIEFEAVANGLRELKDHFDGRIWPEVMLVEGYNDSDGSLSGIASLLSEIRPDKVFLSVPTRPPSMVTVRPAGRQSLESAMAKLPKVVDMTMPEPSTFPSSQEERVAHLISVSRFHPLREGQAIKMLLEGGSEEEARTILAELVAKGRLRTRTYGGERYYKGLE